MLVSSNAIYALSYMANKAGQEFGFDSVGYGWVTKPEPIILTTWYDSHFFLKKKKKKIWFTYFIYKKEIKQFFFLSSYQYIKEQRNENTKRKILSNT